MRAAHIIRRYAIITLACALYAVGFNWFFVPNHLTIGGFTGLAQIINYFLPVLPVGTIALVLNIPLFILGWRKIGRDLLISSLYATAVSSLMIDLLTTLYTFDTMDPILAGVYGGIVAGAGCGLLLYESATTGGTEMAARLLKLKFQGLSIGSLCLVLDVAVTAGYALCFRDMTRAMYGIIALYIISLVIDRVVYGPNASKVAYIISEEHETITRELLRLDRGVTLLPGKGAWSGKEKQVILCAVGRRHIIPVKKLVQSVDPHAFVIVCDAHEVLGEGFGRYDPTGL